MASRFNKINKNLDSLCESESGFFKLPSSEADTKLRLKRYRLSERKFRRAKRFAAFARLLPSVKLVAVGNSLAWSNAVDGSDIDIFLVTSPGAIWTTRLVLGAALMLLGLRPTPRNQKDKLCLSFIISQDSMDISEFRMGPHDVYFPFWLAGLVPVYDAGGVMKDFWEANQNMLSVLPGSYPRRVANRRVLSPLKSDKVAEIITGLMRTLEPLARLVQKWRFPPTIRHMANDDSRVVVNDRVLKFHVGDRRESFAKMFTSKLNGV